MYPSGGGGRVRGDIVVSFRVEEYFRSRIILLSIRLAFCVNTGRYEYVVVWMINYEFGVACQCVFVCVCVCKCVSGSYILVKHWVQREVEEA